MDVMEAIRGRRSVRAFEPDDLPEELLDEILEAGTWAPSHRNAQPWDFVRVGPQARAKLLGMLSAAGVDLTLYGHVHTYLEFTNAGIPAYISGGGGAIPGYASVWASSSGGSPRSSRSAS